eukprot:352112-Chlamydomonas_euryale.AAC.1
MALIPAMCAAVVPMATLVLGLYVGSLVQRASEMMVPFAQNQVWQQVVASNEVRLTNLYTNFRLRYLRTRGSYGRGGGYALWDSWRCWADHEQRKTRNTHNTDCDALLVEHAQRLMSHLGAALGCERWGLMDYPKCAEGYYAAGCWKMQEVNLLHCTMLVMHKLHKLAFDRVDLTPGKRRGRQESVPPEFMAASLEQDGLLCYPHCASGYNGIGPVCWTGNCPAEYPHDCGLFCTKDASGCAEATGVFGSKSTDSSRISRPGYSILDIVSVGAQIVTWPKAPAHYARPPLACATRLLRQPQLHSVLNMQTKFMFIHEQPHNKKTVAMTRGVSLAAQPPLAKWIRRGQPAHTPPQLFFSTARRRRGKGRHKNRKRTEDASAGRHTGWKAGGEEGKEGKGKGENGRGRGKEDKRRGKGQEEKRRSSD